jgi:hypothetical protein
VWKDKFNSESRKKLYNQYNRPRKGYYEIKAREDDMGQKSVCKAYRLMDVSPWKQRLIQELYDLVPPSAKHLPKIPNAEKTRRLYPAE